MTEEVSVGRTERDSQRIGEKKGEKRVSPSPATRVPITPELSPMTLKRSLK